MRILGSLLVVAAIIGADAQDCFSRATCDACLDHRVNNAEHLLCDWIPDRFSCAPRNGEDDFLAELPRVSDNCDPSKNFSVPPREFRHLCEEGGVYSIDPKQPFGATCDCPNKYLGSKCQVCNGDTLCPANSECHQDVRQVKSGEVRALSCDCTSDFCKQIGFGPGDGVVNVDIHFSSKKGNTFAQIDILKSVPRLEAGKPFHSPFLIRANLTSCTEGDNLPCKQACGAQPCPAGVPWTEEETCRVWKCNPPDFEPAKFTQCPPGDYDWSLYSNECNLVERFMLPPFVFTCVVPENPLTPLVNGKLKCGFTTDQLPPGNVVLDCAVGSCAAKTQTPAPTQGSNKTTPAPKKSGIEAYFVCSGNYGDQECWNTYYLLILLFPSVYSLIIVFGVFSRERDIRAAVHASRILRSHLLETSDDVENRRSNTGDENTATGTDGSEASHETDEFLQSGVSRLANSLPSPILSFSSISFAVMDTHPTQGEYSLRPRAVRARRRGFRTVLQNVSGHVRSGELCAIMGPSGSGKTSLIDIIAGRKNTGKVVGNVFLDGVPAGPDDLRDAVGYVTQDDVLPSTSTVRELLLFHATLRGNSTMPLLSRCERVQDLLEELGLINCADAVIGGPDMKSISGGERRRVSIACELLGEHTRLLVMDEPTSGLDSNSTQSVITALQAIVEKERRTVILSIHQPSSNLFRKFSRVILLSATGRCLYCGPHDSLEIFFPPFPSGTNPAEYLIDMCVGNSDEAFRQLEERFETSPIKSDQTNELKALLDHVLSSGEPRMRPSVHRPALRKQVVELSTRAVRQAWRHPVLAMTNVVATLTVGICCGLLYRGVTNDLQGAINRAGLFFFFLCFLMLASIADLGVFQEERLVLMRERASGAYSALSWFVSKTLVEIMLLRMVPLCVTTFILTYMVGLNPHPQAIVFMFVLLLVISITATLQFLCLGMVFSQNGVANFAAILITMFSLLMSGFLLQFDGTGGGDSSENSQPKTSGFEWLQTFSVLHFGFEALMVNELHGLNFQVVVKAPDGSEVTRVSASGDLILAQLGFLYENFAPDVGRVFAFLAVSSLACLLFLQFAVVERR